MTDIGWIALSLIPGMGAKRLRDLLASFDGDLDAILRADEARLRAVRGIGEKTAAAIRAVNLAHTADRVTQWEMAGVRIILPNDALYPVTFKNLDDAPNTLFVRGDWMNCLYDVFEYVPCGALVGTRQPSEIGAQSARSLAAAFVSRSWTVVSGLALGIDAAAHSTAIQTDSPRGGKGRTIAVLGSGVLNIYPPENRGLASAILDSGGALMCEVAPDAEVTRPELVARNRLIAGLCRALVVVESNADSGALHAARFAKAYGREVYTMDLDASGNRDLIADGIDVVSGFFQTRD